MGTISPISSCNKQNPLTNSPISEMGSSTFAESLTISKEKLNLSCSLKRKRPPNIQIPNVLQEIEVDGRKFSGFSPVKDDVVSCFEDGCGFVGVFSVKGKKKFMEDTYKVLSSIDGNPKKGFFGVYDGHGGRKAAEFVAAHLHRNVTEMVENCQGKLSKEEAVKAAYLKTDIEFLEQDVGSGACCISVLIDGSEMVVSNAGDCRAVLCRGGVAEALTKDHRAEREDEQKRIADTGGYVEFHKGAWRVHGVLSVSRSIGDAHLKNWVVSEPDTMILELSTDMDFLVLASDGLWDVVGCQEAVDILLQSSVAEKKKNQRSVEEENENENACVTINSSPKLKRVSLLKKKQTTPRSPSFRKMSNVCDTENESPPAKLRRTALFPHINMKSRSLDQENTRPSSEGLVAACKKLVNLAVTRGSLDDITVMIIDLKHYFKQVV